MGSRKLNGAPRGPVRPGLVLAAVVVLLLSSTRPARALIAPLVYNGSDNSVIRFGASPYGGAPQASPVWAFNPTSGLNDILASPGGGFLSANPVTGNDVASVGPSAFGLNESQTLSWTGGKAPLSGAPFGTGSAEITGFASSFALTDASPGASGTASYGIETWNSNYTQLISYKGNFGTYLSVGGSVPDTGSVAIAAIHAEVFVTPPGGSATEYVLTPLILAVENLGGGKFNTVALSEGNSISGANIVVDTATGNFTGFAMDSYGSDFVAGSSIKVTSTTTFYADPASIETIAPDLSLLPGLSLPGEAFGTAFGSASVPEPGSMITGGTAAIALSLLGWIRRRSRGTTSSSQ